MTSVAPIQASVGLGAIEPLTRSRILLVDDSPVMLSMMKKYLEVHDFTNLKSAANGEEALAAAHAWFPDIILTDIQMPVMDGYELCKQIRAGSEMPDVPILFMTGLTKPEDRNAAFSAGASDLISKPVDHLELVGRLRVHLDRRRLIKRLSEYHSRMAQELYLAREMQEAILPSSDDTQRIENKYPVAIGSYYQASLGLGGDLWTVQEVDANRLLVCMVDFSGHGVGAALNTFRIQAFLNNAALAASSPSDLLEKTNQFLHSHLPLGQFATMFCGVLDFPAQKLTYASASAPPMVIGCSKRSAGFGLVETAGLPLGLLEHGGYEDIIVPFETGCALLLYSDALIETPEPPDSVFTPEKLGQMFARSDMQTDPRQLIDTIVAELMSRSPKGPDDDLTLVCLRHLSRSKSDEPSDEV